LTTWPRWMLGIVAALYDAERRSLARKEPLKVVADLSEALVSRGSESHAIGQSRGGAFELPSGASERCVRVFERGDRFGFALGQALGHGAPSSAKTPEHGDDGAGRRAERKAA
jgi:hypothetical protein